MLLLRVFHVCVFIVVSLRSSILTCCNESLKLVFVHVAVPCVVYIALWIWILVYTSSLDLRIVFVVILLLWITHCGLTRWRKSAARSAAEASTKVVQILTKELHSTPFHDHVIHNCARNGSKLLKDFAVLELS